MEISDIFKDALKFPASNWKRFLILVIISLVSALLATSNVYFKSNPSVILIMILPVYIITFFVMGYSLRTIKVSINGENELPAFNRWIRMFIGGLKVFLINILYFIIPIIFIMIGVFLAIDFSAITTGKLQFNFLSPVPMIVLAIGILLYALFTFFYEIGIANMAYQGKLEAALSLSEIREIIRKIGWKKYLVIFVILIIFSGISSILGYVLNQMPLYGLIISAILISPYIGLIRSRVVGLIYMEAL